MVLTDAPTSKIAFLMLAHEHPVLCARLALRLINGGGLVVVHLDSKVPHEFQRVMREHMGGYYDEIRWARRVSVEWGEWSMVEATLRGLEAIRDLPVEPDYVYLLSGSDYPIAPLSHLQSFLARNNGIEYIESVPGNTVRWVRRGIQTSRYSVRHFLNWRKHPRLFSASIRIQQSLGLTREMPSPLNAHFGAQWWVLTWSTCLKALELARRPDIEKFFRTTWVPDELFFQTVVRTIVPDHQRIQSRALTHYQFTHFGVPAVFSNGHGQYLHQQPFFFARKISPYASGLRDFLDQHGEDSAVSRVADDDIGNATARYKSYLRKHRQGLAGKLSWGRPGKPPLGALERNLQPYFVILASDDSTLKVAQEILQSTDGVECHGRLFSHQSIEFTATDECVGYHATDIRLRDQDRRTFLFELLQNELNLLGFCWHTSSDPLSVPKDHPLWKPTVEYNMLNVLGRDPRCHIIEIGTRQESAQSTDGGLRTQDLDHDPELGQWHHASYQFVTIDPTNSRLDSDLLKAVAGPLKHHGESLAEPSQIVDQLSVERKKRKKLFIHIGIHRTGTTTIQHLLDRNRNELHDQGFHYALHSKNHNNLKKRVERSNDSARQVVSEILKDASRYPDCNVIISAEDFAALWNIQRLKPLTDSYDVQIVVYLRRQDAWLESWYNQNIKWPWLAAESVMTAQEFLHKRERFYWIDYARTLDRWAEVFQRKNIKVAIFEEARGQAGLTNHFCHVCGIEPSSLTLPPPSINASAPPQAVEFLRHMRLFNKQGPTRQFLLKTATSVFKDAGLDTERHVYSGQERLQIIEHYKRSNSEVARHYFSRTDGLLFRQELPPNDLTPPAISLPDLNDLTKTIARPLVSSYLELLVELQNNRNMPHELERELYRLERKRSDLLTRQVRLREITGSRRSILRHLLTRWTRWWR